MMVSLSAWLSASAALLSLCDAAPSDSSSPQARCCTLLQLSHQKETFAPNTAGYKTSIDSYWSLQARVSPSCIVTPSSAKDVADMTKILVENSCPFAVRSGGHNPFPDNNIANPGVTMDLSRLSSVSLATKATGNYTASIGPGARWGDVYNYLGPKNISVPGGRAATVGVGGLTLGGGNSFFAARYGFVCDNVENFQVVLASGKIVDANAKSHPDLWQVLKGGSNNFGIVTRIDLTAFQSGDIWGGVVLYPSSTIPDQITAFVNFTENIDKDPYGSLITFWAFSSATNSTIVENCYEYTKPVTDPPAFNELLAIKPEIPKTNTLGIRNLTSLTVELEAAYNLRDLFATLSFANDGYLISQVYKISQKYLAPVKTTKGLNWITMFQPLPSVISQHSVERGGNILGLDRAKGNQVLFLFFVQWSDESDDQALQTAASNFMTEVKKLTISEGKDNDWIYLNYALQDQDPLGSYGAANVAKMQAASKKYDPNGVFQKLVTGGYKIANAKPTSQ